MTSFTLLLKQRSNERNEDLKLKYPLVEANELRNLLPDQNKNIQGTEYII